ncbi:hypothetical protein OQJ46_16640 [Microbulbifer thermotolerans]|uniref:hypothetical protein n=2 Tax=Microbulbifer thermotolerans TaxID=252514 RepID=UPI0008DFCC06|nr:hypothetical protein [Microbulbifer thermotolerans]MCX2781278.1 hypothetical protein [Microbulbifer thermotolerans]MCX2784615.1 hypothetical protein [Microbulbifer thermotolerans]MCX2796474.1 hypothetical protein [Microbulbifer thermotolerans]MCX2806648.1 hypothetical protein [Microbulbifer thermotolerans]MCX2806652.1 hypothetical protein [Microbulbifer thermotolerans]
MRDDYESHFVDHHDEITYHNKKTMKKMIQATLLAVFVPVMLLTGCDSSNGAADATAEAIVVSGLAKGGESRQMLELFKQQPEFKNMVACLSLSLSNQGWSGTDHDAYMTATDGTGDFGKIDSNQCSEQEAMGKFGAIMMASGDCM